MSLICSFDETKNRRKFYRIKDCIEIFCRDLKELRTEIINYKDQEMTTLASDEVTLYEVKQYAIYAKKSFVMIKIRKVNMLFIIKSEIIATTQKILDELLIIFAI